VQARRHGRLLTLALAATALLALASTGSAATFCVGSPPSCPAGGTAEPTIVAALTAAGAVSGTDTIRLGAGTFSEPSLSAAMGNPVAIVGMGTGQTTITRPAANFVTTLQLSDPGSSIEDVTVRLADGTTGTGLSIAGSALRVDVTASPTTSGTGLVLIGGLTTTASFSQGSVTLPTGLGTTGVVGATAATLEDATVTAASGVLNVTTIRRTRVTAVNGIQFFPAFNATSTVDDVLVQVIPGTSPGLGLAASANAVVGSVHSTLTARHVTLVGSGVPGSVGVAASAAGGIFPGATSATTFSLSDAIVRGFATDLSRMAITGPGSPADTSLSVDFSDYDPTRVTSTNISGGTGAITAGSHNLNVDPMFVNAAGGDDRLAAGSPLIDHGNPPPPFADEPTTDLDGNPRIVDGNGDGLANGDIGAYEYQPPPPPPPPSGPQPVPPPAAAPSLTELVLKPARFAVGRGTTALSAATRHRPPLGTTIRFKLSRAASVALTVQRLAAGRRSGRSCVKPTRALRRAKRCTRYVRAFRFTRNGKAGSNAFPFSGRAGRRGRTPLAPGAYRLLAVATADRLSSAPKTARFTIVGR
jgi:hypothetical protein